MPFINSAESNNQPRKEQFIPEYPLSDEAKRIGEIFDQMYLHPLYERPYPSRRTYAWISHPLLERLPESGRYDLIVDMGTGVGTQLGDLMLFANQVVAFDTSIVALERAAKHINAIKSNWNSPRRLAQPSFSIADMTQFCSTGVVNPSEADLVIADLSLSFTNYDGVLKTYNETFKSLRDGGLFLFDIAAEAPRDFIRWHNFPIDFVEAAKLDYTPSAEGVHQDLERTGFEIIDIRKGKLFSKINTVTVLARRPTLEEQRNKLLHTYFEEQVAKSPDRQLEASLLKIIEQMLTVK